MSFLGFLSPPTTLTRQRYYNFILFGRGAVCSERRAEGSMQCGRQCVMSSVQWVVCSVRWAVNSLQWVTLPQLRGYMMILTSFFGDLNPSLAMLRGVSRQKHLLGVIRTK